MLKLVGTDGKRLYSWLLERGKYRLGRKSGCDFSIPHGTVSGNHAEIEVLAGDDEVFLTDLDSHNGTLVNGARIASRTPVKKGDLIMFAEIEFKLAAADEPDRIQRSGTQTKLSDHDPENSVFLSIDEALKPPTTNVLDPTEILSTLVEMAELLVQPLPKEVLLQRSLSLISKVIVAERLAVLLVSEDQDEVYPTASLLPGGKDPGAFTLSRTIVGQIIEDKDSLLVGDPKDDPRFAAQQSIIMSELKSVVAVPLFDEGDVLGILYADTNRLHSYSEEHLKVLMVFGNLIVARLLSYAHRAERQEAQIIEAELRRASQIQNALLVTTPPKIAGHAVEFSLEQSRSVGGDLFDLKKLPDGRLLFLVADVSGKGMGAAILMSNILASIRAHYESPHLNLSSAVERASLQIFQYSASGDFATLFIGLLEPDTGRIRFINAGHNPPLVVRAGGTVEHLEASGVMIGAFDFATWTEECVDLSDNDLLFIYSDGVTEAERGDSQYGEERMERLVVASRERSPNDIAGCLMDDINGFMGDAPRSDDITMLIIKRVQQ